MPVILQLLPPKSGPPRLTVAEHVVPPPPQTVYGRTCGPPGLFMAAISGLPSLHIVLLCCYAAPQSVQ